VVVNHNQSNSLIGLGEAKTQNSALAASKNASERRLFALARPIAGVLALTACTVFASSHESFVVQGDSQIVATATTDSGTFQRADLIDDIIDCIDKIINPPPPDEEDPNP
jgi:hypothetical protein